MNKLILILGFSLSAHAADVVYGPCDQTAKNKAEELYGRAEFNHETTVDGLAGDPKKSGYLTYEISTGNGEEGFGRYSVVIRQTLGANGGVQCEITSAD